MTKLLQMEPDLVTGALEQYREDVISCIAGSGVCEAHYNASQQWLAGVVASEAYVRAVIKEINGMTE